MWKWIIILVIVAVVIYKIKESKEDKEREKKEAEERARVIQERKKSGEPETSVSLPPGAEAVKEQVIGPDGKSYPDARIFSSVIVIDNLSSNDKPQKYEYSPVYGMLASGYYINNFVKRVRENLQMHPSSVELGIACIYEQAENYAYPVPAQDDLVRAVHYTRRRLADRKRAMEGNGYWKNAYDIPVDGQKALQYYELAETLRTTCKDNINKMDKEHVLLIARCWLQAAHLYGSGLLGVQRDAGKSKNFYSQAFQMAMHFSLDDMAMEVVSALGQGYPRNPGDYGENLHNMLADWACRSDLGLAMYAEYIWCVEELDRERLALSAEEAVKVYTEQAEENHYAAYMLGLAKLYGYGTEKDEEKGRSLIELAASDGCVAALYLLGEFSLGDAEAEKKWKAALDGTVAIIVEKCAFMRAELEKAGKSVTKGQAEQLRNRLAQEQALGQMQGREVQSRGAVQESAWEAEETADGSGGFADGDMAGESGQGFAFPRYLYDGDGNPWELMNSGGDNATYYCQKTGGQMMFYTSDFASGAPGGFRR